MTSTKAPAQAGQVVISAEKLRRKLESGRDVAILEVRRDRAEVGSGQRIPGAHPVVLTTDLVGPAAPADGSLPLPTAEQVRGAVRRWGINSDSIVVVYSPENPALAARVWWTLRWAGLADVRVLDGGLAAWTAAGGALGVDIPAHRTGTAQVRIGSLPTLDADRAAELARNGVLFDARAAAGYDAGHIPGALPLPGGAFVAEEGKLLGDDELRALIRGAGAGSDGPVGAYCGAGTGASLAVLALAKIGVDVTLYPGSFSAWISDPARPVATGSQPG